MLEARGLRRLTVGPVDLQVDEGECVAIMGPSGSGKSILLRMMADLDPHEGDTLLDARSCHSMPAPHWRRQVTYVPAEAGWWSESVQEHFEPGTDLISLLEAVGIDPAVRNGPASRLSTGERQRLALLRALRPACRVLLLDEPTSGLDPVSVEKVEGLLRRFLSAPGRALVLVTHDAAQAERMSHRQFNMNDGECRLDLERAGER